MDNQLRALSHIGMFTTELPKKEAAGGISSLSRPVESKRGPDCRVKTYLQVNCSMCHVADGGGNSLIDLAYKTPIDKARMVNEPPIHESFSIAGARLIAPGDAQRSVLYYRMSHRGEGQMPPTSTNRIDDAGAGLLREWIRSFLLACPSITPLSTASD